MQRGILLLVLRTGVLVGVVMMTVGFPLWYLRYQRHLDHRLTSALASSGGPVTDSLELPSDSLYKFATVLGLTLALASGAMLLRHRDWVYHRNDVVAEFMQRGADSLQESLAYRVGGGDTAQAYERLSRAGVSAFREALREDKLARAHIESRKLFGRILAIGIALGSLLSASGFWLWYRRLQVRLDCAVAKAAGGTPPSRGRSESNDSARR
jgi:hypothetical protein